MNGFLDKNRSFAYIIVKQGIVSKLSQLFLDITEYSIEEIVNKEVTEVFGILRIHPDVKIGKVNGKCNCYIFTKSLDVRFVSIKTVEKADERIFIIKEKDDSRFEDRNIYVEQLLKAEYSGIAVYSVPDLVLIKANQKFLSFLEPPFNELRNSIGKRAWEMIPDLGNSTEKQLLQEIVNKENVSVYKELEYKGFQRGVTYWDLIITPIIKDNRPKYVLLNCLDVTDSILNRKELEEKNEIIRRQKEQLEIILESMSDGIMVKDKDGNTVFANAVAKKAMGNIWSGNKNWESKFVNSFTELDGTLISLDKIPMIRALKGEIVKNYQLKMINSEEECIISINAAPVYQGDELVMAVTCNHDITESVKNQRLMKERAEHQMRIEMEKERNEALKEVLRKVKFQASLLNLSTEAIFAWELNGGIIYWNNGAEKMYEYTLYEAIGAVSHELLKTVCSADLNVIKSFLVNSGSWEGVVEQTRKDGKKMIIETRKQIINNEMGQLIVLETNRDISERIAKEKEIRNQKEYLETIINSVDEGLMVINKEENLSIINSAAEKMLFKPHRCKKGWDCHKFWKCMDANGAEIRPENSPLLRTLRGESLHNYIISIQHSDGIAYYNLNSNPLYSEEADVSEAVFCLFDITEQFKNERKIREQKAIFEAVIENMHDAIGVYDMEGRAIMSNAVNRSMHSVIRPGAALESIYQQQHYYDMEDNVIPLEQHPLRLVFKGKRIQNERMKVKDSNGRILVVEVNAIPIRDIENEMSLAVICHHDISDIVEYEEKLKQQSETLENAMKTKDEFIYLITHEFKTPMAVINSALQAIDFICKDDVTERLGKFLNTIKVNTNRQLRLVNNLLDITRISSGYMKINISSFDIVYVTRAIINSVEIYSKQKSISLNFSTRLMKKEIYMDEEKFERIMMNLLSNALKFTPAGKSITVGLSIKKDKKQNYICISVQDEGIGIPEDRQKVIFERFGQADTSLSRKAEGTGLGLHLVTLMVNAMGGQISLESEVNKGSTFTILLPDNMPEYIDEVSAVKEEEHQYGSGDNRILQAVSIEFSDIYMD